jgi:hypothetical protein
MGFWQGLNEGIIRVGERRDQERAVQEERAYSKQEKAEARAFEKQLFMEQLGETRRDNLLTLFAKRDADKTASRAVTGQAQAFFSRLGDVDDPRVAALVNSPSVAAELEDRVSKIEIARAEAGLDTVPLTGETLLDFLVVQNPDTGEVNSVDVDLDELLTMDMSDRANYERMVIEMSQTPTKPYATIKPEAYRVPAPKVLEESRLAFDETVMQLAQRQLEALDSKSDEWTNLFKMVEQYPTAGSAGRTKLREMFGTTAYEALEAIDSPYIQGLKDDPQLSKYNPANSTVSQLQRVMSDPEASPDDKARAQRLLNQLQGN